MAVRYYMHGNVATVRCGWPHASRVLYTIAHDVREIEFIAKIGIIENLVRIQMYMADRNPKTKLDTRHVFYYYVRCIH